MASILNLPKNIDDVQEAQLLDEDWYTMRLVKDPKVTPNAVLKAYMKDRDVKDAEAALAQAIAESYTNDDGKYPGLNWTLELRVVHEDPMVNGRGFRSWLQLPNDGDKKRVNTQGQTLEDEKMEKIVKVATAFNGRPPEGNTIELEAGMTAQYYVIQEPDFRNPDKMSNSIDMNTEPQPA